MARLFAGITGKSGVELHRLASNRAYARVANWDATLEIRLDYNYDYTVYLMNLTGPRSRYAGLSGTRWGLLHGNLTRDMERYLSGTPCIPIQLVETPALYRSSLEHYFADDFAAARLTPATAPGDGHCILCGHKPKEDAVTVRRRAPKQEALVLP